MTENKFISLWFKGGDKNIGKKEVESEGKEENRKAKKKMKTVYKKYKKL